MYDKIIISNFYFYLKKLKYNEKYYEIRWLNLRKTKLNIFENFEK